MIAPADAASCHNASGSLSLKNAIYSFTSSALTSIFEYWSPFDFDSSITLVATSAYIFE